MKFNNKDLQKVHIEREEALSDHINNFEKIKEDIKLLENILQSSYIPKIKYIFKTDTEEGVYHLLTWGYFKNKEGIMRIGYEEEREGKTCIEKPLSDCCISLKFEISKHLSKFYNHILDTLK